MGKVTEEELRKGYKFAIMTGVMMLSGLVVLVIILNQLLKQGNLRAAQDPAIVIFGHIFILGEAVFAYFLLKLLPKLVLNNINMPGNQATSLKWSVPVIKLLMTNIIAFAICESVAIGGVVFYFNTAEILHLYLGIGLSLILYWPYFPRYRQWQEWVVEYERQEEIGL